VRVRVGERTETIVVFLTRCIPKGQLNVLAVDLDICNIVLKDGGDVDLRFAKTWFQLIALSWEKSCAVGALR
jgi:hypothetical protein